MRKKPYISISDESQWNVALNYFNSQCKRGDVKIIGTKRFETNDKFNTFVYVVYTTFIYTPNLLIGVRGITFDESYENALKITEGFR